MNKLNSLEDYADFEQEPDNIDKIPDELKTSSGEVIELEDKSLGIFVHISSRLFDAKQLKAMAEDSFMKILSLRNGKGAPKYT